MTRKSFFNCLKHYGLGTLIIGGWWLLAFKPTQPSNSNQIFQFQAQLVNSAIDLPLLSPLKREVLQKALAGDFNLMVRLMLDWDIDAQLLLAQGTPAKRIPQDQLLRSQMLVRTLMNSHGKKERGKFLPQTYASASFLLALATPEEIVAIPKNLREQEQIYPRKITDKIALDIDRYNSEKLFLAHPQIAFVAHYSHPATVQALENQGIPLYRMKCLNTVSDITSEIISIGNMISRPLEAELLKLFMEAAMAALDNRLIALNPTYSSIVTHIPQKILFLNYNQTFSLPTHNTLTGELLQRLGIEDSLPVNLEKTEWALPVCKENIVNLNPDCLIIAAENIEALEQEIRQDPALNKLSAVRKNRLFFVDQAIQQSPSQYIVLAYHDLIDALAKTL